jgi:murein DD-endopeptidase MepM/ murein hydrolase activator NlpD
MEALRLYYPCKPYRLFQKFGECDPQVCHIYQNQLGLKGHNGEDVIAQTGTVLRAAHDGIVTFAGEDGSAGYGVVIRTDKEYAHKDGKAFYKSIYWHLFPSGIYVKAGQKVQTGDVIALSDNTGMSTGPHLHFGCKPMYKGEQDWEWTNAEQDNGYKGAVDPSPYWTGIHAEDYGPAITAYQKLLLALKAMIDELQKPH